MNRALFAVLFTSVAVFAWTPDTQAREQCPPGTKAVVAKNGKVTCVDGKRGVRLPTGTHNVSGKYRIGRGTAGNLPAEGATTVKSSKSNTSDRMGGGGGGKGSGAAKTTTVKSSKSNTSD